MASDQRHRGRVWRAGLIAAGVAAIVNGAVFAMGRAVDVSFVVPSFGSEPSPQTVTLAPVVFNSITPVILGTALGAFMVWRGRGVTPAQVAGGAVALLSVGVPLSLEADTATRLLLASMHLVVGVVFIAALQRIKPDVAAASSHVASDYASNRTA